MIRKLVRKDATQPHAGKSKRLLASWQRWRCDSILGAQPHNIRHFGKIPDEHERIKKMHLLRRRGPQCP